jgi:iron complex transport system substrate-binding protein
VSVDEIAASKPEVVVVAPCGYAMAEAMNEIATMPPPNSLPVWVIDANRLTSSPGPGVVRGIEVLARILHPSLFGSPSPHDAVQITA